MDEVTRPCRVCGTAIARPTGVGAWAKSCSDECRKAHEKARQLRRYAEDPDYFKEGARRWQAANSARYKTRKKQYNVDHPEVVRGRNQRYYVANRDRLKQAAQDYRVRTDYFRRTKEAHYVRKKAFYAAHPERAAEYQRRRRAQKLMTGIINFDPALLTSKLAYWGPRCWMCGGEPTGWDHVKPLSKGGSHILANLRPACQPCNSGKHNRWPFSTAREVATRGLPDGRLRTGSTRHG